MAWGGLSASNVYGRTRSALGLAGQVFGVLDVGGAAILGRAVRVAARGGAAGDLDHVVAADGWDGHLEVGADDLRPAAEGGVAAGDVVGACLDEVGVGAGTHDETLLD